MRGVFTCLLIGLVCFAQASQFNETTIQLVQNVPANGTIGAGEKINFSVFFPDWRYAIWGFQMNVAGAGFGEKVGTAKVTCESHSVDIVIKNKVPVTEYNDPVDCDFNTTIVLTSTATQEGTYWAIAAHVDSTMYHLVDNTPMSSIVSGESKFEYVSFRGYIGKDEAGAGAVDVVNITVTYDQFASTRVRAFVSQSQRPDAKNPVKLVEDYPGHLVVSLHRGSPLFCHECFLYVGVIVTEPKDLLYFSVDFKVDRDIIYLQQDDIVTGVVEPDTHSQYFIIDLRNQEYDSRVYIGIQKKNELDTPVVLDVSRTSFDDGEWDICKSVTLVGAGLREWGIDNHEPCFSVGAVYYIRMSTASHVTKPCTFSLVYRITRVPADYLYVGKNIRAITTNKRVGITYYRVNIPTESFVDVQAMTITMTNISYTYNPGPVYPFSFDIFMGKQMSQALINNPKDPSTYTYTQTVYGDQLKFMITEDQDGWCTGCSFGFTARTTNETQWTITAELTYAPFVLRPNVPRRGNLKAYTNGIDTYFYLNQKTYSPITINVQRINEHDADVIVYVSTTPKASIKNHFWSDSTVGDGLADITLSHDHPQWCNNCNYYIGVYYLSEEKEDYDTEIEITVACPDGVCQYCDKEGFDPAAQCKDCLPGFFGKDCTPCPACNHGTCDFGVKGTGKCKCNQGWGPEGQCVDCVEGYFGLECKPCETCHNNGKCDSGLHGTGSCICTNHFDQRTRCDNCEPGFFGFKCDEECPKTANGYCDGHGTCHDMKLGDGHCRCVDNRVGLKCDTNLENDKCKPHCVANQGGCDEDRGVCVCYHGFGGKDCGKEETASLWMIVGLCMTALVFVLVAVLIIKITKPGVSRKKTRNTENTNLLGSMN